MRAKTLVEFVCRDVGDSAAVAGLCNAADAVGAALAVRGVDAGAHVAALLPPGPALEAALLGAAAIRAALVPVQSLPGPHESGTPLRTRRIRAVIVPPGPPADAAGAAGLGVPVVTLEFDADGHALVDGDPVYEAHGRTALPDDVVLVPPAGPPLTQSDLVSLAGDGGLSGLRAALSAVLGGGVPAVA